MASAWVRRRETRKNGTRFRVEYRLGGAHSPIYYAGTFGKKQDAIARKSWVIGEIAAMRVPDAKLAFAAPVPVELLAVTAERWRSSKINVSAGTDKRYGVDLSRILPGLGARPAGAITKADCAELVRKLHDDGGLARETIRKTLETLAMILDHAEVRPNPARDVTLPERQDEEVVPPTAAHVERAYGAIGAAYRLPLLVLDATGMRVGELEALRWGDVDEPMVRWRISKGRTKTRRARWVAVPDVLFRRVVELVPREDRNLDASVFGAGVDDRLRTALARACKATGVPLFSPHDLRHRRASLWHLAGIAPAEAAGWLGHSPQEHLRTYAHVVLDRREVDYATLLGSDRTVLAPMLASLAENVE